MSRIRVWAPHADSIEAVAGGARTPLSKGASGWHEGEIDAAEYSLSLDGGPPRPDPRSAHQPVGVDGPSRVVDHSLFPWTDATWRGIELADAVLYEMHTGTFTPAGTFDAATEKLDHLVDLGVTALELMPVAEFPGERGWGYDGVDLYAPHHGYGGPDGLKRLVDACHRRGLAVVLDVVYNHLGPAGNYLREFGPYFTGRYSTPWGDATNFDGSYSDEVRRFCIDNALMWLRHYHIDGLRLDAVHAIFDRSAVNILEQLADEVSELATTLGRRLFVIAESDLNDPRVVWDSERGGYGIDAQWSDDFHHALHALLTGEKNGYYADFGRVEDVAVALQRAFVYDGRYSRFRRRRHGRSTNGLGGNRFLAYLQNHDQIGNRALGERTSALIDLDLLKVGAALVMTSPFVPMLFQGEEWAASTPFLYFTDHRDPDLARAVGEGRAREFAAFGWDPALIPHPQDTTTFQRCKLDWSEIDEQPHADLLEWHRSLIRLRAENPVLRDGRMDRVATRFDETGRWLVVERGPLTIACNFSGEWCRLEIDGARTRDILLTSSKEPGLSGGRVELAPESVTIFEGAG